MSVCHGGNSDELVSIPDMTGTVAVNICVYFNGLQRKTKSKIFLSVQLQGVSKDCRRLIKYLKIMIT